MENSNGPLHYAGFWARFAAYFIDGAVMALFLNAVYWMSHQQLCNYLESNPDLARLLTKETSEYSLNYKAVNKLMYYVGSLQSLLFGWAYFAGMESSSLRGTISKLAIGAYVTDLDGNRISFAQATGRYFGKIVSGLLLGIGYIMAGTTDRKQALHDKMADCLVMKK